MLVCILTRADPDKQIYDLIIPDPSLTSHLQSTAPTDAPCNIHLGTVFFPQLLPSCMHPLPAESPPAFPHARLKGSFKIEIP